MHGEREGRGGGGKRVQWILCIGGFVLVLRESSWTFESKYRAPYPLPPWNVHSCPTIYTTYQKRRCEYAVYHSPD